MDCQPLPAADIHELAAEIEARIARGVAPLVVALDGRSGVGKSTAAKTLAGRIDASVLEGDDFFAGGVEILTISPRDRVARCIDYNRQRRAIQELREGRTTTYRPFDWEAFDGRLATVSKSVEPNRALVVEGVYSARPELADLIDLRILVVAPDEVRWKRLLDREGSIGQWERQWHEAESWYFEHVAVPSWFHFRLETGASAAASL